MILEPVEINSQHQQKFVSKIVMNHLVRLPEQLRLKIPQHFSSFTGIVELQKMNQKVYITFSPSVSFIVVNLIKNEIYNEFYLLGVDASPVSFSISPLLWLG